jgi:hypothetical protein
MQENVKKYDSAAVILKLIIIVSQSGKTIFWIAKATQ